ncbi:hypothetical protein V2J09_007367 [Rumex salicifolius]
MAVIDLQLGRKPMNRVNIGPEHWWDGQMIKETIGKRQRESNREKDAVRINLNQFYIKDRRRSIDFCSLLRLKQL